MTLALASCRAPMQAPTSTPEVVPLYFVTSSSTDTLLRNLAATYTRENSLVAIVDQTANGTSISAALDPSDPSEKTLYALTTYLPNSDQLWAAPLGQDGIAVVVHPRLTLPQLSADDLRRIFTGAVENWTELGGPDVPITVVSREAESDTRRVFEQLVLGERQITYNALLALTDAAMLDVVSRTPGAIGFVSMALVSGQVRVMPLVAENGDTPMLPTPLTVADGSYPLRTPLLIIGKKPPEPGDGYYEFIVWAQQHQAQQIIGETYAPLP
ncbi:MAG: substrate-binding domain-containing protein [Chloroflexi bacterium]|nr:substrate-binding domain-containing protein [Chloroflexota bacterium]